MKKINYFITALTAFALYLVYYLCEPFYIGLINWNALKGVSLGNTVGLLIFNVIYYFIYFSVIFSVCYFMQINNEKYKKYYVGFLKYLPILYLLRLICDFTDMPVYRKLENGILKFIILDLVETIFIIITLLIIRKTVYSSEKSAEHIHLSKKRLYMTIVCMFCAFAGAVAAYIYENSFMTEMNRKYTADGPVGKILAVNFDAYYQSVSFWLFVAELLLGIFFIYKSKPYKEKERKSFFRKLIILMTRIFAVCFFVYGIFECKLLILPHGSLLIYNDSDNGCIDCELKNTYSYSYGHANNQRYNGTSDIEKTYYYSESYAINYNDKSVDDINSPVVIDCDVNSYDENDTEYIAVNTMDNIIIHIVENGMDVNYDKKDISILDHEDKKLTSVLEKNISYGFWNYYEYGYKYLYKYDPDFINEVTDEYLYGMSDGERIVTNLGLKNSYVKSVIAQAKMLK
jgi:hypothetical protein